ncbi:MAG: RDD family protein [Woeseiaceae bacterium]
MAEENPYSAPESDVDVETVGEAELASRWLRLGGAIIDGLIIGVVFWMFAYAYFWQKTISQQMSIVDTVIFAAGAIVVFLAINGFLLASSGQTVAKRLLGMQIVSIHDDKILPFGRLVGLRYLPVYIAPYIPIAGQIFGLVNVLFIFGSEKRCIHDYMAGTKVIKL